MHEQKNTTLTTTNVTDLGAVLPHGTFDLTTGKWETAIDVRVWNLGAERELAKLISKAKTPARQVSLTLARMCSRIGGLQLDIGDEKQVAANALRIGALTVADVTYAYVWLRMSALGPDLDLELRCRACGNKEVVRCDLGLMDVRTAQDPSVLRCEHTLQAPFVLRGETVQTLTLAPARWRALEEAAARNEHIETAVIQSGIVGKNGAEWQPHASDLDQITKRDAEAIFKKMDSIAPGPTWAVEMDCPRCQTEGIQTISWLDPSFFRASSR